MIVLSNPTLFTKRDVSRLRDCADGDFCEEKDEASDWFRDLANRIEQSLAVPMPELSSECRITNYRGDMLTETMRKKFGIVVEHEPGFLGADDGGLVTTRVDGEPFTPEQHAFLVAYSDGYTATMREAK